MYTSFGTLDELDKGGAITVAIQRASEGLVEDGRVIAAQTQRVGNSTEHVAKWLPIALFAGLSVIGAAVYLSRK